MEHKSDVQSAVEAGERAADASKRIVTIQGVPTLVTSGQTRVLSDVLDVSDKRAPYPPRRRGTAKHQTVESFIEHVNRHKDEDSVIFADIEETKLTAILNYHRKGGDQVVAITDTPPPQAGVARWGDHRSVYDCPLSDEWELWNKNAEEEMTQVAFGEFIDANFDNLAAPEGLDLEVAQPADVLSMARNLSIKTKSDFKREYNPTTGESTLHYSDEHDAGSTRIPRAFHLGVPVFALGKLYRIEVRLHFSLNSGRPVFSYRLHNAEVVLRDAFEEIRKRVIAETALPVFVGTPE